MLHFLWVIAVQFPQAMQDRIECDNMMTFETFGAAAAQASGSQIPLYPIAISLGKSDTPFECIELRSLHLVLLYLSK